LIQEHGLLVIKAKLGETVVVVASSKEENYNHIQRIYSTG
jgi:hypothetical protein